MAKTAFIGLGVMGFPMAGYLMTRGGHEVTVYNRTTSKAESWVKEFGGTFAETPEDAALGADFVMACVGNDDDLRSVTTGPGGAFHGMKRGAVFIDHTTASLAVAKELAVAADEKGISFLDAPVSGGQAGAENGALTVMVGGADEDFERSKPIIDCYAKMVGHMGAVGAGQLTKMVNQICIAGLLQGLSEGIFFAEKAGLDVAQVISVISKGAAQSWQMDNRWEAMANREFNHGFAVDWMRKDLDICLSTANDLKSPLPVTALVDQFYKDIQNYGGNRFDTSSLITRLDKLSGKGD